MAALSPPPVRTNAPPARLVPPRKRTPSGSSCAEAAAGRRSKAREALVAQRAERGRRGMGFLWGRGARRAARPPGRGPGRARHRASIAAARPGQQRARTSETCSPASRPCGKLPRVPYRVAAPRDPPRERVLTLRRHSTATLVGAVGCAVFVAVLGVAL